MAIVAASLAAVSAAAASGVALGAMCSMQKMLQADPKGNNPRDMDEDSVGDEKSHRGKHNSKRTASKHAMHNPDPEAAGWEGFSMEDARNLAEMHQVEAATRSPAEVLAELQRGNARFWMGNATRPERSAFERRSLISKVCPQVAILGCSDSRVPVEIIFDQGLGDMSVVRVAGNVLDTSTMATLQYAVHFLKIKVLIVLGHEGCGALKAASLPYDQIEKEPAALQQCLKTIKAGLDFERLMHIKDPRARDREVVVANVVSQVAALTKDRGIMEKVESDSLIVCGAFYEMSSGIVDFFSEVLKSDAADSSSRERAPSRGVLNSHRADLRCSPCKTEK